MHQQKRIVDTQKDHYTPPWWTAILQPPLKPSPAAAAAAAAARPHLSLPDNEEVCAVAGGHKALGVQHESLVNTCLVGL
jgi:hypothetical protein